MSDESSKIWTPDMLSSPEAFNKKEYADSQFEGKAHGAILMDTGGGNFKEIGHTMMCPHCGQHFISRKGSGHRRTFCMKHMQVTCGKFECDPCKDIYSEYGITQNRML